MTTPHRGERSYRTPPAYEIVPWERLSGPERRQLAGAADLPELYGVLRPRDPASGLPVKALDRDTALLALTLRVPGPLPRWAREDEDGRIRELVLEGVLQVREDDEFVSGPEAVGLVSASPRPPASDVLEELSRAALEHAAALPLEHAPAVASRLYGYHRLPLSPRWERRLSDVDRIRSFLGLGARAPDGWRRPRGGGDDGREGWFSWWRAGNGPGPSTTEVKLYVSPRPEALPEAFHLVAEGLLEGGAAGFKVGSTAGNLLRPDKLVAYLPDRGTLQACASRIEDGLDGVPAHGVPFTAPAGSGPLLSWGADPPSGRDGGEATSWRAWVCRRLAGYLVEAREAGSERCVAYARERIRADGVDPDGWRPSSTLWDAR